MFKGVNIKSRTIKIQKIRESSTFAGKIDFLQNLGITRHNELIFRNETNKMFIHSPCEVAITSLLFPPSLPQPRLPPPPSTERCSDVAFELLSCIDDSFWEWKNYPKHKFREKNLLPLHTIPNTNSDFYKLNEKLLRLKFSCNDDSLQEKIKKVNAEIDKNGIIIAVFDNKPFFVKDLYEKMTFEKKIHYHFTKSFSWIKKWF